MLSPTICFGNESTWEIFLNRSSLGTDWVEILSEGKKEWGRKKGMESMQCGLCPCVRDDQYHDPSS